MTDEIKYICVVFAIEHVFALLIGYFFGIGSGIIAAVLIVLAGFGFPILIIKYLTRQDGYIAHAFQRKIY